MREDNTPNLFGLDNSNRDFSCKKSWGKNIFNSSFPAALCCYLSSKNIKANYLSISDQKFGCAELSIQDAFGIAPLGDDTYFAFEGSHTPYQQYVIGALPRTDLVIQRQSTEGTCLAGIEVKLTALPDNPTCNLADEEYGCELVVRPDSIIYLACSIAKGLGDTLGTLLDHDIKLEDWSDPQEVLIFISEIIQSLKNISIKLEKNQVPFLLQPIWKTKGKSPQLAEHCLDVFFWSDAGFTHFITEIANADPTANRITRQTRTAIWLYKMLLDISQKGHFNQDDIIDKLTYNTKNDKAFACSGNQTHQFMTCDRLTKPIITKSEIKNIILGGGQDLLSPERRFDAILYNSPDLFDS